MLKVVVIGSSGPRDCSTLLIIEFRAVALKQRRRSSASTEEEGGREEIGGRLKIF